MNSKTKTALLTYVSAFLTLFIVIFFTRNVYIQVIENKNTFSDLQTKLVQNQQQYNELSEIKKNIESGEYDAYNFDKYLISFSEDEISNYFYNYANTNIGKVQINSIVLTPGVKNEFGFMEGKIDLGVTFASEIDMLNMLSVLLENNTYDFYIHTFQYPFGEVTGPFMVDIPLKVLYK